MAAEEAKTQITIEENMEISLLADASDARDLPWTQFERSVFWRPPAPLTEGDGSMCFVNSRYSVVVVPLPAGWTWLEVVPRDGLPVRRWRDLQRIKNELMGPEREAVEVFPAESRLHDP